MPESAETIDGNYTARGTWSDTQTPETPQERESRRELQAQAYRRMRNPEKQESKSEEQETSLQQKFTNKRATECVKACTGLKFTGDSTDLFLHVIMWMEDDVSKHPEFEAQAKQFLTLVGVGV